MPRGPLPPRRRPGRRPLAAALVALAVVAALTALGAPASADDATPDGDEAAALTGSVLPNNAGIGDRVAVYSAGWAPDTQVQAVLCGDLAIGGSQACDLPRAALGSADDEGVVRLQLALQRPPRPCPCVVHLSPFSGGTEVVDVPINVAGVRMGTPPVRETPEPADLTIEGAVVDGGGSVLRRLLGLGGDARVVITISNDGGVAGAVPELRYGFGSGAVETSETMLPGVVVPAGESREVMLDVDVPVAAVGTQMAVVGWADRTGLLVDAEWSTVPWLAIVLLLIPLPVGLLWHRARRRPADDEGLPPAPPEPTYPLPDVVYVDGVGGLLVRPGALRRSQLRRVGGRLSAEDLALLAAGGRVDPQPVGRGAPGPVPHVVTDLSP
ncbi:hypothetical protein [Nocardioides sp. YIM 152588]|uniref:hypothetical protein n=1 Tax=Nocardioides sp. YIM 152588 TaxID=3158259 RepID=UPI0032E44B2E